MPGRAVRTSAEPCRPRTGIALATLATVLASLPGCETEPVTVAVLVAVTGNGTGTIEASEIGLVCEVVSGSVDPSPCETRFMDDDGMGHFTLSIRPEASSEATLGGTASMAGAVACSGRTCTASYDERRSAEFRFDVGLTLSVPALVQVAPSTTTIDVGEMINVSAEAFGASGVSLSGRTFSWSSSDPSIARVQPESSTGSTTVTGIAPGVVTVSAATGGVADFATITVERP